MDLEGDCSTHESVGDNGLVQDSNPIVDRGDLQTSGLCLEETDKLVAGQNIIADRFPNNHTDEKSPAPGLTEPVNSGCLRADSPGGASTPTSKGYKLKKWRRIKREFMKDDMSVNLESSKVLKRGLTGSADPPAKPANTPSKIKQISEGSVGSVYHPKVSALADGLANPSSSPDSRFAMGLAFSAGTDSENSEGQSSKSSTAASAPRFRHASPMTSVADLYKMKNTGGKGVDHSPQKVKQGKVSVENCKKPREVKAPIEKENSQSSIESDSRSSNFPFMQGAFSIPNNEKQAEQIMNHEGEYNDEAFANGQAGYRTANVGKEDSDFCPPASAADASSGENHCSSTYQDLLADSMNALLSVQEALEKEVKDFQEIGRDYTSLHYDIDGGGGMLAASLFTNAETNESSSSHKLVAERVEEKDQDSLKSQILSLMDNIKSLETKLELAWSMLEVKTSRISELEAALDFSKASNEKTGSTMELQNELCKGIETELEGLFRQKIEAEIEILTLKKSIEKLKGDPSNQLRLFQEQKVLAGELVQVLNKTEETENRAAALKKQTEELQIHNPETLGAKEDLKRKICKLTFCFSMQLSLLVLVWLFIFRLLPEPEMVVPT